MSEYNDTVLHTDPAALVIGANVRLDATTAKEFIASIRERGVIEPIIAHRDPDQRLIVIAGQRRTLAAVQAGLPSVPVLVRDSPAEADRIIDQLAENEHRAGLRPVERVQAIEQLSLVGLSAAQIAKRTATKRAVVDAALSVAAATGAKALLDQHATLTLDQAAVLAEFDGDDDATERLLDAAGTGRLEHVAQRLRDERAEQGEADQAAADLAATGVPVLDRPGPDDPAQRLSALLAADGTPLDPENHRGCPGHAAWLVRQWVWQDTPTSPISGLDSDDETGDDADNQDGGEQDLDDQDGGEEDLDDEQDEEDDLDGQGGRYAYTPVWVCTDPAGHGHTSRYRLTTAAAAPVSEQDAAAAKAERLRVVENNKAWRSAQTVRRAWLAGFVARRTPPTGAEAFIARALLTAPHDLRQAMEQAHPLLRGWLHPTTEQTTEHTSGLTWGGGRAAVADLADALGAETPKRATMLTLAAVLAAWEAGTSVQTWRHPDSWDAEVMGRLVAWGYTPSDVENLLLPQAEAKHDAG